MNQYISSTARKIASRLTDEQKARLLSGVDFWHLYSNEKAGIPEIMVSDGPHGLRQMVERTGDDVVNGTVKSTCFPAGGTTAGSFDPELLRKVGKAIGEEARKQGVNVVLGPAVNHKRSPLCGRNFEYICEDPYLTGELASAIIDGIQSCGVGTSIKHFACNSQEKARFVNDSIVDERALREIYLRGFETAIKKSKPWTIMASYNLLNGIHATENKRLLTDIARDEWGFDGLIMTDWAAITNICESYKAGLDLEMPGSAGDTHEIILAGLADGTLPRESFERAAQTVLELIVRANEGEKLEYTCDMQEHFDIAREAAEQSAVLLKNDGILPFKGGSVAVIGSMAKRPRYQGGGSSHIEPVVMDSPCEAFEKAGIKFDYADGYGDEELQPNEKLIKEAADAARDKDIVFIFAGLPASIESEGFDRDDLEMPQSHIKLIEEVSEVNHNVVVILSCGSPVTMPWLEKARGVLLMYLGGCQMGAAAVNLLTGKVNPSGKLAETFPLKLEDTPCHGWFANEVYFAEYRESIFTGYRYYDTVGKEVLFPFGSGLSYTTFSYSGINIDNASIGEGQSAKVSVTVTNTGSVAGKEIAMLFAGKAKSELYRPARELKGFKKIELQPGESKVVEFEITPELLSVYNTLTESWYAEPGEYTLFVGPNIAELPLTAALTLTTEQQATPDLESRADCYYRIAELKQFRPNDHQFAALPGVKLPDRSIPRPLTLASPVGELNRTFAGRQFVKIAKRHALKTAVAGMDSEKMIEHSVLEMPIRASIMAGFNRTQLEGIVWLGKGKVIKGLRLLSKKNKK